MYVLKNWHFVNALYFTPCFNFIVHGFGGKYKNVEKMLAVVHNVGGDFSHCFTIHHDLSKVQKQLVPSIDQGRDTGTRWNLILHMFECYLNNTIP